MKMGEAAGGRTRDKSHQERGRKTKENWSNKQLICKTVSKLSSISVAVLTAVLHVVLYPQWGSLETANHLPKIGICPVCVAIVLSPAKLPWLSPYGKLPSGPSKPRSSCQVPPGEAGQRAFLLFWVFLTFLKYSEFKYPCFYGARLISDPFFHLGYVALLFLGQLHSQVIFFSYCFYP